MKFRFVFATVMAVGIAVVGILGFNWLADNKLSAFEKKADIYVYPNTTVDEVVDSIVSRAAPKWPARLGKVLKNNCVGKNLKPGHYVIEPGKPAVYVARMLNYGWQTPVRLTLSGSLRSKGTIASKIASQMMADSAAVFSAFEDPELLSSLGGGSVFGMILPDSYEMYWTASPQEILRSLKKSVDDFWTAERLSKAEALSLTRDQVTVLASIVTGETRTVAEMPRIAGVYINRLRKGIKLQADPTIAFCYDYKPNRILRKMLSVDSPYNTYRYAGLPPGPICVPDVNALKAVLDPDLEDGYLYFCADPSFNGTHRFARTYSAHLANARAFRKALNARNRK